MVVVVVVGGADKVLWDGVAEEDAEDRVPDGVGLVLVKGDQDKGVFHEALVVEERLEERPQPDSSNGDGRVMAVGGHVGG